MGTAQGQGASYSSLETALSYFPAAMGLHKVTKPLGHPPAPICLHPVTGPV